MGSATRTVLPTSIALDNLVLQLELWMNEPEPLLVVEGLDVPSVEPRLLGVTPWHCDQRVGGGTGAVSALLPDESWRQWIVKCVKPNRKHSTTHTDDYG